MSGVTLTPEQEAILAEVPQEVAVFQNEVATPIFQNEVATGVVPLEVEEEPVIPWGSDKDLYYVFTEDNVNLIVALLNELHTINYELTTTVPQKYEDSLEYKHNGILCFVSSIDILSDTCKELLDSLDLQLSHTYDKKLSKNWWKCLFTGVSKVQIYMNHVRLISYRLGQLKLVVSGFTEAINKVAPEVKNSEDYGTSVALTSVKETIDLGKRIVENVQDKEVKKLKIGQLLPLDIDTLEIYTKEIEPNEGS